MTSPDTHPSPGVTTDISFVAGSFDPTRLARDEGGARPELDAFRAGVAAALARGETIDPVSTLADYNGVSREATGKPGAPLGEPTRANFPVALRNAVLFPDTFKDLDTYGAQRASLADALGRIGVLDGDEKVVVTMVDPNPKNHRSDPERKRAQPTPESFRLLLLSLMKAS